MSLLSFSFIVKAVLTIAVILAAYVYLRQPLNSTLDGAESAITRLGGAFASVNDAFAAFGTPQTAQGQRENARGTQERLENVTDTGNVLLDNSSSNYQGTIGLIEDTTDALNQTSDIAKTNLEGNITGGLNLLENLIAEAEKRLSNLIPTAYADTGIIREPQFDHVDAYYSQLARQQAINQEANFFGANNANVTLTANNPSTEPINASPQGSISEISFDKSGKATSIFFNTLNKFVANQNAPARQEYSSSRQNNANFTSAIARNDQRNAKYSSNLKGTPAQHKQAFNSRKATQADKDREASRALDRAKSLYGENYGVTNF